LLRIYKKGFIMADYQVLIIGGGPGGYVAALEAAKLGFKTGVIENRELGGTCLNRGCIPTKALLHSSEIIKGIREGAKFGAYADNIRFDLPQIFARKNEVSRKLSSGIEQMFKQGKIDWLQGKGQLLGTGRAKFTPNDGSKEREVTAEKIILATGSVPAMPPIPGLNLPGVMTSDELLEGADHLYESIIIIGGGVIGVELATFYNDMGSKVTIIEGLGTLMPILDKEIGQNLAQIFKKRGAEVYTNSMVSSVEKTEKGFRVNFKNKDKDVSVEAEAVLSAIGRSPNTAGVVAEGVEIQMNRRAFAYNENYETSIPGVYTIGDACAKIQLAHYASAMGRDCVKRFAGERDLVDFDAVPSCIYTVPEIACVGKTLDEAKEAGIDAVAGKVTMFANGKTLIVDGDRAFMKVIADKATHRILGAQFMCERASDMISEMSEAIVNKLTVEQMLAVMRPHPTFEEAVHDVLEDTLAKLNK
jgi:dihydrolipoamide dehydrogenase